ncbi:MAG: NYN domain-containing protein [Planctomycetales bacterium]|nr:NYN domain-containing protein [Planctomycetales bacterium]
MSFRVPILLLIDGYNLLHASGVFGDVTGEHAFHHSRMALLNALADRLEEKERRRTLVVFDAAGAPPGLPSSMRHRLIHVRFARGHADADELIELLIEDHRQPKQLLVVSSDHRIQRAARQRGAGRVDSDIWYRELQSRPAAGAAGAGATIDREATPTDAEVAFWLEEFGVENEEPMGNGPFPPGYGEDLEQG